ncbi:putative cytosine-specific methyltransferase [Dishui Lake large algae virus 1]|nr:putative cytosine-specific methyltransferase [Dishui Lake large algae virus 1]
MPKAISLFSGAGGDTLGLENANVNVCAFVEWETPMIETHLRNFPNSVLLEKDVRNVTEEQLIPYIGEVDIIFAGFPCQGLSKAGKKNKNDERNNLFREFVRITNIIRPRWIIGENVKHILKMVTPDERPVTDVIREAFEEIGYTMAEPMVLKGERFGISQKRERCFFVGYRNAGDTFSWDNVTSQVHRTVALRNILEPSLENAIEITHEQATNFGITKWIDAPDGTEVCGTPPLNLRKCIDVNELSFGKRASPTHSEVVDPDGFSKTLICTYNRMPRMFVAVRCSEKLYLRPYTINEAKQIQGFPKEYIITGNRMNAIKQIGNAVPPPLVEAIVKSLNLD